MEVLTKMGSAWPLTTALTLGVVGWGLFWWRRSAPPAWLAKALSILLVLRFAVPVVSLGSEWVYSAFLADDYKKSQEMISASAEKIDGQLPLPAASAPNSASEARSSEGVISRIMKWLPRSHDPEANREPGVFEKLKSEATSRLTGLLHAAETLTEHMIKLMVVFLLQTLAIPLLLVWILLKGSGVLLAGTRQ